MRKASFFILLIIMLFVGILIGKPSGNKMNITQEEIDKFEENLENGDYQQTYRAIKPNAINSIGRKIENMLDNIFGKFND